MPKDTHSLVNLEIGDDASQDDVINVGHGLALEWMETMHGGRFLDDDSPQSVVLGVLLAISATVNVGSIALLERDHDGGGNRLFSCLVKALQMIGSDDAADKLLRVLNMFPAGVPQEDLNERQRTLDSIDDDPADPLGVLEDALIDHEDSHRKRLAEFIRNHFSER